MRYLSYLNFRWRLVLLVVVAVLPALILINLAGSEARQISTREAENNANNLLDYTIAEKEDVVEQAKRISNIIAQYDEVRSNPQSPECGKLLSRLIRFSTRYANFGVIDMQGNIVCSAVPLEGPVNVADRSYFQRAIATKDFSIGDYQIGRITNKAVLVFARPVLDENDNIKSVIYISLDLSWLNEIFASASVQSGAILLMVDGNGTVLSRYPEPEKFVGKTFMDAPIVKRILAEKQAGIYKEVAIDNIERLFAVKSLAVLDKNRYIFLAVGIPATSAFKEAEEILSRNILLLILTAIFSIFIAWFIGGNLIAKPIRMLIGAFRLIGQGKLDTRVKEIKYGAEMSELIDNFNEMAMALEQRTEEASESEQRFNRLVNQSLEGVMVMSPDGIIKSSNDAFLNITGFSKEELKEKRLMELVDPDDKILAMTMLEEALRGQVPKSYQLRLCVKRGECKIGEFDLIPSVKEGKVVGIMGLVSDVSAKKRIEAKIEELNKIRAKFIDIVSHQLRTPLNAIRWNLETLLTGGLGELKEDQKKFINITLDADLEVVKRIGQMLTAVDIEGGRIMTSKQPASIEGLVSSVVGVYKRQTLIKGIEISYDEELKGIGPVIMDTDKIRNVIDAFLENAVAYTPNGGKISVSLLRTDSNVRLEVSDSGVGIPKDDQPNIFSRFFRATNAGVMKQDSSGLALYIAKFFIEQHNGNIGFRSKEGEGSVFWFEIPVSKTT